MNTKTEDVFETWPEMIARQKMERRLAVRMQLEAFRVSRSEAAKRLKMSRDALNAFCVRENIDRRSF